ncbi:hypothetical protein KIK84_14760 [Curvibacter sp. CHRR-16]|uniref:YCF48-related protein n=1 Tax=Curvibacter sp. CHRR-16 TaxID=2835872 RepID=UPI001BDACE6E|nr:sialidase family protein [Curvibacter sp. CHRR-16]MBT0571586.1 hypothetical protein [Curvibacter sp. CHRR-16]
MVVPTYAQTSWNARVINPTWHLLHTDVCNSVLTAGSDGTIWRLPSPSGAAWETSQTAHNGRVVGILPYQGNLLAIGTRGLLLHSQDCGQHWTDLNNASSEDLLAVASDGTDVLVAGDGHLLLRARASLTTWQQLASPALTPRALVATQIRHGATQWWLLDQNSALWSSNDAGEQWHPVPAAPKNGETLTAKDGILFMGTGDGSVHMQTPAGQWRIAKSLSQGTLERHALDPNGLLWMWGKEGACVWTTSTQWQRCRLPTGSGLVTSFAATPDSAVWVTAAENGLIYRSTDKGRHWHAVRGNGDIGRTINAIAWDGAHQRFIAAGDGARLLVSSDAGKSWNTLHTAPPGYVNELEPLANGDLLAAMNDRWMARSADADKGWLLHQFVALDKPAYLTHITRDPNSPAVVVSGSQGALIYSADGRHWQASPTGIDRGYLATLMRPQEGMLLLFGTPHHGLQVNLATGNSTDVPLPNTGTLYGGFQDPERHVEFLLGERGTVLQSIPSSASWHSTQVGKHTLRVGTPTPDGSALLVAGDSGSLYRAAWSANGTLEPWQAVGDGTGQWRHVVLDRARNAVWLIGMRGDMRQSLDQGLTWHKIAMPTQSHLRQPVFDTKRRVWWLPGRDGTLLRGNEDGTEWHTVFTHTTEHLKGVLVHPQTGHVYAWGARLVKITEEQQP